MLSKARRLGSCFKSQTAGEQGQSDSLLETSWPTQIDVMTWVLQLMSAVNMLLGYNYDVLFGGLFCSWCWERNDGVILKERDVILAISAQSWRNLISNGMKV